MSHEVKAYQDKEAVLAMYLDDFLTLEQAANMLGVSPDTLQTAIDKHMDVT